MPEIAVSHPSWNFLITVIKSKYATSGVLFVNVKFIDASFKEIGSVEELFFIIWQG